MSLNKENVKTSAASIRVIPESRAVRDSIRNAAKDAMRGHSRDKPMLRAELEALGRKVLAGLDLPEAFLGFCMVAIDNEFWRDQFMATPFDRRLLLLPHCLRDSSSCRADYDEIGGLQCIGCGKCEIKELKAEAERLGYRVLVAEGTPAVVQYVFRGEVDCLLGVSCLESLDEAFEHVSRLGIAHASLPLIKDGCVDTEVEIDLLHELMASSSERPAEKTRSFYKLLREANELLEPDSLTALLAPFLSLEKRDIRERGAAAVIYETEDAAVDWLNAGGKHFRPFLTLAVFAAVTEGTAVLNPEADISSMFPMAVKRVELAMEVMHKASLVHDDIEDGDSFRYNKPTLHEKYGIPTAINIGDYLVGLGYRLISSGADELGAECVARLISGMSEAHLKLSRGQGAELAERNHPLSHRDPKTIQTIYVLKTAAAFEVALMSGLIMAGDFERFHAPVMAFSRYLGVAYQVINDMNDFDLDNISTNTDVRSFHMSWPTMQQAFAVRSGGKPAINKMLDLEREKLSQREKIRLLRALYEELGVFDKATKLIDAYRRKAFQQAESVADETLGELMMFIAQTVLIHPRYD